MESYFYVHEKKCTKFFNFSSADANQREIDKPILRSCVANRRANGQSNSTKLIGHFRKGRCPKTILHYYNQLSDTPCGFITITIRNKKSYFTLGASIFCNNNYFLLSFSEPPSIFNLTFRTESHEANLKSVTFVLHLWCHNSKKFKGIISKYNTMSSFLCITFTKFSVPTLPKSVSSLL